MSYTLNNPPDWHHTVTVSLCPAGCEVYTTADESRFAILHSNTFGCTAHGTGAVNDAGVELIPPTYVAELRDSGRRRILESRRDERFLMASNH